jgi:GcrA cell cycle regulator
MAQYDEYNAKFERCTGPAWPLEKIHELYAMWTEGLSTKEIARRLSSKWGTTSKNSVVGKAHRLDLEARPSPIRRDPKAANPYATKSHHRENPPTPRPRTSLPPLPSEVAAQPETTAPSFRISALIESGAISTKPAILPPISPPPPQTFSTFRRPSKECCWPVGEPGTKAFRFCCEPAPYNRSYCEAHAKLAYVKIRDRRDDDRTLTAL